MEMLTVVILAHIMRQAPHLHQGAFYTAISAKYAAVVFFGPINGVADRALVMYFGGIYRHDHCFLVTTGTAPDRGS